MTALPEVTAELLRGMPLPQPEAGSKDERGRVLVVAGSAEVPGAAVLAGTAALRAGAGRLRIATVKSAALHVAMAIPEAFVIGLAETSDGGIETQAGKDRLQPQAERTDAVLIGPGMTDIEGTTSLAVALCREARSLVLDAAAVCGLKARAEAVRSTGAGIVITPHSGEMAQLLEKSRDEIESDPLSAAQAAADLLRAVVVMKGAESVIVGPEGRSWIHKGGCVGLATSGSGDVLAGVIAGLLARGTEPAVAALWGVYLHGQAGVRLSERCGPLGFLARELPGEVPPILRGLTPA